MEQRPDRKKSMNKILWILRSKKRGDSNIITAAVGISLFLIVMYVIFVASLNYYRTMNTANSVDSLARTYLLKIEANGALDGAQAAELIADLKRIGMENIQICGNFYPDVNMTEIKVNDGIAEYDTLAYLQIEGTWTIDEVKQTDNVFNVSFFKKKVPIRIILKGRSSV